jgi:hypothetical protein
MKQVLRWIGVSAVVLIATVVSAQSKLNDERMQRDIEIAENVLETMLRQEFGKRNFFPYEINGNYMPGYGVTFRLPVENFSMAFMVNNGEQNIVINSTQKNAYSYSMSRNGETVVVSQKDSCDDCGKVKAKTKVKAPRSKMYVEGNDSLRKVYTDKVIEVSKVFLADYGDLITQLAPEERIMITNRGGRSQHWNWSDNNRSPKRIMLNIEATKGDLAQFKQGKLTRDQLISKIKIVNTETADELDPDLELLASIINRLYRPDLSKTYYAEDNIYYERMKDFGVIYYMQTVSSRRDDLNLHKMPTLKLSGVDEETRNKKVKELYPAFEKEIKENILEYGRTLKSLKAEEMLVFNIQITKCVKCDIPSSLELSIKNSVLSDYSSGKINKDAALAKFNLKKGPNQ